LIVLSKYIDAGPQLLIAWAYANNSGRN